MTHPAPIELNKEMHMDKYFFSMAEQKNDIAQVIPPYLSKGQFFAKTFGIFEPSAPPDEVHVIATELRVVIGHDSDGVFNANNIQFIPFQAQFKSKRKPQVLIIDLSSLKMIKGVSVTGLKFGQAEKIHIDAVFVDYGDGKWPLVGVDDTYDRPVDKIMIHFKMPTNKKTAFYKFFINVKVTGQSDIADSEYEFKFDPQVGNDPP